tara:strand:+ start:1081 stop:1812 length:732 start_codon:yes stop_codon:yes gene_type:complete
MAIQYERTMSINYGNRMNDDNFKKLSAALADKGIFLTDSHASINTENFGFKQVTKENTVYGIVIEGETVMSVDWASDAKNIVEGFKIIHPDITYSSITTTTERGEWIEPEGDYLSFTLPLVGTVENFDCFGYNQIAYSQEDRQVEMNVRLLNGWGGLELTFRVSWSAPSVQRKEVIEQVMVDTPLKDMGNIQKVVESRLKLKKFGYDVEDVEINCHFDAKTESRSECTPDIIKQVREARKGNQ